MTTAIPLTTTFTPPAACTTDIHFIEYVDGNNFFSAVSTTAEILYYMSLGPEDWSSCFPSGYATSSYFSPGICPSGYTQDGFSYITLDGNVETRATCCPEGYNAQTGTDWPWYSTNPCTSSNPSSNQVVTFTYGSTLSSQTGTYGVNAKGISIRYQAFNFASSTTTATATATGAGTATATGTSSTGIQTSTITGTTTSGRTGAIGTIGTVSSASTGLSTGAKVGIGVGAGVGALLLLTVAYLIYLVRKRNKQLQNPQPQPSQSQPQPPYYQPPSEMEETQFKGHLMQDHYGPVEMSADR
ncbi:hypothetical protein ASPZODRAFT_137270 [Penicilliopsis zonata CBS 506.65]|uniref:Mid2 domain-containing protein n=1 Tax=Penicilliopsis zonata CBS 506.65 TaxID=1073090 RepID=A0A1L9S5M0_9EURO|nr:hypothetical protein ASPZODRAFT_137270 [Penicilliopsis zonata CBS 506.65]OJJ42458.1 hypothetical protein ASPZODRAFT_137270 [Penicilliopsis zonata CBS 506.65]